jgi:hypothetical protein
LKAHGSDINRQAPQRLTVVKGGKKYPAIAQNADWSDLDLISFENSSQHAGIDACLLPTKQASGIC